MEKVTITRKNGWLSLNRTYNMTPTKLFEYKVKKKKKLEDHLRDGYEVIRVLWGICRTRPSAYLFTVPASSFVWQQIFISVLPCWATKRHGVPSGKWFSVTVPIWFAHSHLCSPISFPEPGWFESATQRYDHTTQPVSPIINSVHPSPSMSSKSTTCNRVYIWW
jgi:hypothetical protein